MASGMWVVLVVPAILAFIFGAWVMYSVMLDVSEREFPSIDVTGSDTIRMRVDP